jgi:protein-tyrosine phosphatase
MKILMVCLGNICRSPMAEGVMRQMAKEFGIKATVDSAGTQGYHIGEKPDHRAIKCMAKHDIDISNQRARRLEPSDLDHFDVILTMDQNNLEVVTKLAKTLAQHEKIAAMMDATDSKLGHEVPDPYYGTEKDFEVVYQLCHTAARAWCERWSPS